MPKRAPWRSSHGVPSLRPSRKLVTSPPKAQIHAIGIMTASEISPEAATTPPSASAVSPGAMRPTNAPVSRNASAPTSA